MREEVLASVARIGGRLGELRLDTDLDISHGVVRYLELLKLAALLQRPPGQSIAEALADINARLLAATTPLQREIFQTSTLDDTLLSDGCSELADAAGASVEPVAPTMRPRARDRRRRDAPSLVPFLPRKGIGLALSASDIETYRSCPLRYKFARVLRIPTEQTLHQRFGIAVHQVLERYHSEGGGTLDADAGAARGRLAPGRLRRARARARAAREGARGAHALPRAAARRGLPAGVVRAPVRLPARPPPSARARRPRRSAAAREAARSTS